MLYIFNALDSASKTMFTDSFTSTEVHPGPVARDLCEHFHQLSERGARYALIHALDILGVVCCLIQADDLRTLSVQIYP
jgi:hypothetical protein